MYTYFEDSIKNFLIEHAIPQYKKESEESVVKAYLRVWKDFTIFA